MRVKTLGDGKPGYTIVGSVHGDEPCGKKAIERFLSEDWEVRKPVRFIIANEEALSRNERFLDTDLNRSFPGDEDSDKHEERLAARLLEEVEGTRVVDLHSTRSHPEPFATMSMLNDDTRAMCEAAGVENAVWFPNEAGAMNEYVPGIVVETGYQGTPEAAEKSYNVLVNFLAAEGIIDADFKRSSPEFFEYYGTVEGEGYRFTRENFELVGKGESFAVKNGEELTAEEDFYPVLMSTSGYTDIVGYKARKVDPGGVNR